MKQLEQVLSIFIERYRLKPTDESRGRDAIQAAIDAGAAADIAGLRRMLTEDYELYPQYRSRVMVLLDEAEQRMEAPASVRAVPAELGPPTTIDDEQTEAADNDTAEAEETPAPTRRRRQ